MKLIGLTLPRSKPKERVAGRIEGMTREETAVKGSYWFIFHGKRDGMNSKLRGTRGSAVYRPGKAGAAHAATLDGRTAVALACAAAWGSLSGPATLEEGVCVHCRRVPCKGPGAYMTGVLTLPV